MRRAGPGARDRAQGKRRQEGPAIPTPLVVDRSWAVLPVTAEEFAQLRFGLPGPHVASALCKLPAGTRVLFRHRGTGELAVTRMRTLSVRRRTIGQVWMPDPAYRLGDEGEGAASARWPGFKGLGRVVNPNLPPKVYQLISRL